MILIAAAFVATAIVLLLEPKFYGQRDAVLAGFAWESLVNKLFGGTKEDSVKDSAQKTNSQLPQNR